MDNPARAQIEIWELLFVKVSKCLSEFGQEDFVGRGDYWVLDDNYGFQSINISVHRLEFLKAHIVRKLQSLLSSYPDWTIKIAIDVPGKEGIWPEMGLVVGKDKIVDQLRREYLPGEFQQLDFAG